MASTDAASNGHIGPMINFNRSVSRTTAAEQKRQQQAAAAAARVSVINSMTTPAHDVPKPSLDQLSTKAASSSSAPSEPKEAPKAQKASAKTNGTKRVPPKPSGDRTSVDARTVVLRQQISSPSSVTQKKTLHKAMGAIVKDQYQTVATASLMLDVAQHGSAVQNRLLSGDFEKPSKPHSMQEIVDDVALQADTMKLRETSKDAMSDGIVHSLSMMCGSMNATNHVGSKDRIRNNPADAYVAAKEVFEGVKPYQFSPVEQKEHTSLRVLEAAHVTVGRTNVKVGQKGPQQISDADKERNKKLRDAITQRETDVLNGVLREEIAKSDDAKPDEFIAFLKEKHPHIDDHKLQLVQRDPITVFNLKQVVEVAAIALENKVESEKRKEQARKDKEGSSDGAGKKKKKSDKKAETSSAATDDAKRKRREAKEDNAFTPQQIETSSPVKTTEEDGSEKAQKKKKSKKDPDQKTSETTEKKTKSKAKKLSKAEQAALAKNTAETIPPKPSESDVLGVPSKEAGTTDDAEDAKKSDKVTIKEDDKKRKKDADSSDESSSSDDKKSSKKKSKKASKKSKKDESSGSESDEVGVSEPKKSSKKASKKQKKSVDNSSPDRSTDADE